MLSQADTPTARLDEQTRELIAIAVGVTRQCDGCITTHLAAGRKSGASPEEIADALGVAIAVNAGAALVCSARAMAAVAAYDTQDQIPISCHAIEPSGRFTVESES